VEAPNVPLQTEKQNQISPGDSNKENPTIIGNILAETKTITEDVPMKHDD